MVDDKVAQEVAREYLANQFFGMVPSGRGDLMLLKNHCEDIAIALENGEDPSVKDVESARTMIRELNDRLDQVCRMYEIPRWKTGVTWGDLSEEEREEYQEADCRN